ncbi:Lsr2 family protein [Frigoribacterium faeni]|uniref:histone-like nucleoid-structuring protein Lsr2 n=1 Tax=Frigoribacterium faeni TaxID=145483 RepID=UPI001FABF5B4|nr:Lsr2 family protein [Frigoribacterium faeni]MCJ0700243.1 Lsr2 family protein [Frigoribacterium faeni]
MARKTVIQLTDDIDGTPIADGAGRTVAFALDGIAYEIDLSDAHLAELHEALTPYTTSGRRTGRKSSGAPVAAKTDKDELTKIRKWARQNGHDVSDRGRVSSTIRDAYDAAN